VADYGVSDFYVCLVSKWFVEFVFRYLYVFNC